MAPNLPALPQIRVSDIEILGDWDFEHVKALGDSIPGYRSSATFLTSLRSNLHLSTCPFDYSPSPSLVSTPTSTAFSSTALLPHPYPSPLSISTSTSNFDSYYSPAAEEPLPPAVKHAVASQDDTNHRSEALRLIADSVAQQRQVAAKALVLHPYSVTTGIFVTSILARYCSLQLLFALSTTLIVAVLATLYWCTRDYPRLAAEINVEWLESPYQKPQQTGNEKTCNGTNGNGNGHSSMSVRKHSRCEDPIVLTSILNGQIIGALVLRVVKRERKGCVRAWTVDSSHRGKGIGTALLQEGVKVAWGKGARGMEFDGGHANSHRALPQEFNGTFEEQESKAKRLLGELLAEHRREKSSR